MHVDLPRVSLCSPEGEPELGTVVCAHITFDNVSRICRGNLNNGRSAELMCGGRAFMRYLLCRLRRTILTATTVCVRVCAQILSVEVRSRIERKVGKKPYPGKKTNFTSPAKLTLLARCFIHGCVTFAEMEDSSQVFCPIIFSGRLDACLYVSNIQLENFTADHY